MKRIIFLTAFALIAAGCAAPNEVKNSAAVNAPPANTQTTEPVKEETFTAGANPRADLISATQKLQKLTFWSARITSETTPEANAEMQFVAPDRYRIKKTDGEVVVIGNDSYSNENGKWEKLDDDIGEFIREQTRTGIEEGVKNLKDVQIVGKEKVDGKEATVYSHKFGDITTKVWIGTESGLQLKNEVEANVGGKMEKQTTVYDYDKKVTIEAPKIN
ncbi:MAG TPA: hypothetical protein VNB22_23230 [Pyrinomonadaceae bacterium]|nr:hypothetical protein [Pyrinomonadaceae bacterium]